MKHILKNIMVQALCVLQACLLLHHLAEGAAVRSPDCPPSCEEGQYYGQEDCCPSCPPRTYQDAAIHKNDKCKPWTTKPPLSHYVIAKHGTSTSDVVYTCEDGYVEHQYTVNGYECILKTTTVPPTTRTTVITTTRPSEPVFVNTTLPSHKPHTEGDKDDTGIIVGVICGVVCIAVGIALFVCWRKHLLCFASGINRIEVNQTIRQTSTIELNIDATENYGHSTSSEPLISNKNYKFFKEIVENLGYSKARTFLNLLPDPSGKFNVRATIEFESVTTKDSASIMTTSFEKWASLNEREEQRLMIEQALVKVGRPNLLSEIEEDLGESYNESSSNHTKAANGDCHKSAAGVNNTFPFLKRTSKTNRADRFTFYHYLASQLGIDSSLALLHQLPDPDNTFNVHEYHKAKNAELSDFENAFAETLEEWWYRNPTASLGCIESILRNNFRLDVVENDRFKELLAKVVPVKTEETNVDETDSEEISPSPLENSDCITQSGNGSLIHV